MRYGLAVLAVVWVAASTSADDVTSGWVKFTSEEPKLVVLFPGKPKQPEPANGVKSVIFLSEDGKSIYMLMIQKLPMEVDPTDTDLVTRMFDAGIEGGKKNGLKVLREREFKLDKKHPVLELDGTHATIPDYRLRLVIVGKWLIQFHVGGPKGTPDSDDAKLFFNSLIIKP